MRPDIFFVGKFLEGLKYRGIDAIERSVNFLNTYFYEAFKTLNTTSILH